MQFKAHPLQTTLTGHMQSEVWYTLLCWRPTGTGTVSGNILPYSGYFSGSKIFVALWLRGEPRNFYPWTVPHSTRVYRDHENVSMNWPKTHCSRKFYPPQNIRYTICSATELRKTHTHCQPASLLCQIFVDQLAISSKVPACTYWKYHILQVLCDSWEIQEAGHTFRKWVIKLTYYRKLHACRHLCLMKPGWVQDQLSGFQLMGNWMMPVE